MAKLTSATRSALPNSAFALPGRQYPIHDRTHAIDALARSSGKPEQGAVRAAVSRRYPDLAEAGEHGEHDSDGDEKPMAKRRGGKYGL